MCYTESEFDCEASRRALFRDGRYHDAHRMGILQAEFSEEETALILEGVPFDQLPAETAAKWKQLDLGEDYDIFPRNLGVFLRRV